MDKQVQPSVHARLRTLEYTVQRLEEQKDADLRRIEQLAARVRELEMTRATAIDYAEEMHERAGE